MSSSRPAAPIVGLSTDVSVSRTENLLWGVIPVTVTEEELETPHVFAKTIVKELGLAEEGQTFLIVQGFTLDHDRFVPTITAVTV